jgi:hypothetical protein
MPISKPGGHQKNAKREYSKKPIILLEHEEQVKNCLNRLKKIGGQRLVIALSPFAMHELDKQGIPYKIPEDYYDPKELYKLGIDNYKKVEELCDMIDGSIQNACPAAAKLGIRPALFSFRHLKVIYDVATIRLFQLFKLINAEKPDVLYIYESKRYPFGTSEMAPYLFFDNRESIYARLLACDGWDTPVVVLPHVTQPEENIIKTPKAEVISWLQRHPKLFDLAVATHKRGLRGLFVGLEYYLRLGKNMRVLLLGAGYNWDDCRGELQSVGIDPIFIRMRDDLGPYLSNQLSKGIDVDALLDAWERLRTDDKFRKFFIWGNVDFFPLVEERLQFLVERLTPACLKAYEETTKIVKKRNIKAVLTPTFACCTHHSAAQAARNFNIPIVTWQHGAYLASPHPIVNYIDIMSSDTYFAFGEGVVKEYTGAAKRFDTQIVPIGSSSLEALYRTPEPNRAKRIVKLTPGKKVVLYVTTNFYQNNLYISYPPPFSDNHFWRTQRAILDVLAKHGDYTVVVKTFPTHTYREPPMRSYAEEIEFKNCQFVKDECTFTDLLPMADLLVIDFLSTPLLEALTTSKPIFVYTGHLYVQDQKLLERRAFCYSELKKLVSDLDKNLSGGWVGGNVDLDDKEFLKAYGISSRGKGSGIRAAKMLKKIMRKRVIGSAK